MTNTKKEKVLVDELTFLQRLSYYTKVRKALEDSKNTNGNKYLYIGQAFAFYLDPKMLIGNFPSGFKSEAKTANLVLYALGVLDKERTYKPNPEYKSLFKEGKIRYSSFEKIMDSLLLK